MKGLAKLVGNPSVSLLVIFLSCLSIPAGFLWQHQQVTSQHQQSDLRKQKHIAEMIHASVEGKVDLLKQQMASIARSPQLATIISRRDPHLIASQQRVLARLIPAAKKACLIAANVDELDPSACIPITFVTLNSLRQARKEGSAPIAVMQAGTADSYLLMTQSIKNRQDSVVGVLAMTVDMKIVNQLISAQFGSEGYVELQQGAQGGAPLVMQGNNQWRQGPPLYQKKVAKSHWHIAYWPAVQTQTSAYLQVAGIVLSLVLLMWLFRERSQRFVLNHDIGQLRRQLADLNISGLKANYPMVNPEMDVVVDDIQTLAQTLPIAKKAESTAAIEASSETEITLEFSESALIVPIDAGPLELAVETQATIELAPSIFKAYDIRGIVGETIDEHTFRTIGQAIGSEALDQDQPSLVVGRDGRLSSESLSAALIEGIIASGCEVVDIGQVPTPVLYFACEHLHTASGVMVTGSHNPANYNGLKIVIADKPIFGAKLQQLYQRILQGNMHSGQGSLNNADLIDDYIAQVMSGIHLSRPLKVVVDCGNGVGGLVAPKLLSAMGCEVIELYCEVDGHFPNHHPNPSDPGNLQDLILAVQRSGAELGLALDGDGDRLGVVDTEGNIIWSDRLLMMFAQDVLSRLPGALVIYDVKCSSLLEEVVLSAGGEALMMASGYALLRDKMKETGAPLAGEMSGHIFFNDRWFGFDDAIYSAGRLLELLAKDPLERSATEVFAAIPNRESTPEMMVEMDELESQKFIRQLTAEASFPGAKVVAIDGVRADYPTGWGLVRASNTLPGLMLRFEADTQENLQEIQQQFKQQMLQVKPTITLLF